MTKVLQRRPSAQRITRTQIIAVATLTTHSLLVAGIALQMAPNGNEPAHLAAGLYHWQTGRFDAYRVNPPLIRLWCALPLACAAESPRLRPRLLDDPSRLEWELDDQLLSALGYERFYCYLTLARLMHMPLALIGGIYCWRWTTFAFGSAAGWAAWWMWVFSPNLLAWSATICPDAGATCLGVAACYHFRRWLEAPHAGQATLTTLAAALAILAKATWILLPPVLLIVWLITPNGGRARSARQLACMGIYLMILINLGYGFAASGRPLTEFRFCSRLFAGSVETPAGNRFVQAWYGDLPVPLPADFLLGFDIQRSDFERRKWSYLAGEWRWGSWPHYYLCAAIWKIPDGFLLLLAIRLLQHTRDLSYWRRRAVGGGARRSVDTTLLVTVPMAMGIAISSQTGFGHHFRYALPCLPFALIHASGVFKYASARTTRFVAWSAVGCGVLQSLAAWPLSHSYFNRLARHSFADPPLVESNLEWGEDLFLAARWLEVHPHARPAYHAVVTNDLAGYLPTDWKCAPEPLEPGWYIVSLQRTLDPRDPYALLRHREPVAQLGASLRVYRLVGDGWRRPAETGRARLLPSRADPIRAKTVRRHGGSRASPRAPTASPSRRQRHQIASIKLRPDAVELFGSRRAAMQVKSVAEP